MSSILKTELKQLVTFEVGARVEDSFEEAKRGLSIFEGRQTAMLDAAKAVEQLLAFVDTDVTEEKIDLEAATVAKRYIMRAVNALQNLSAQAQNLRMAQTGKVSGLEQTVALLKNMADAEMAKLVQLRAAAAEQPVTASSAASSETREVGTRPLSIKEQRLAEAAEEAAAAAAEVESAPPKRRGGRKPRAANS